MDTLELLISDYKGFMLKSMEIRLDEGSCPYSHISFVTGKDSKLLS